MPCKPPRPVEPEIDSMKTLAIGGKVNLARRAQGLTVGGFAKKCRVPEKTMEHICLQLRDPSLLTFLRIIRYGRVSIELFDPEDVGEEQEI